jgi:hypothetical protein
MKKLIALPLVVAMGLAVTACAKHDAGDNALDANAVTSDETITDNDTLAGDAATDNALAPADNADATLDTNATDAVGANASDGNSL